MPSYFTIAEARAMPPLGNATKYPDADITAARDTAESALEDACGIAFVPRAFTLTIPARAYTTSTILLPPRTTAITSATDAGVAIDVSLAEFDPSGSVYLPAGWTARRISVTGTAGYAAPPLRVKRAALLLTKRLLVDTPVNDRATQITNPGGVSESYVTAGRLLGKQVQMFDVPEINVVVRLYGMRHGDMIV
jgi:hypothetical protein